MKSFREYLTEIQGRDPRQDAIAVMHSVVKGTAEPPEPHHIEIYEQALNEVKKTHDGSKPTRDYLHALGTRLIEEFPTLRIDGESVMPAAVHSFFMHGLHETPITEAKSPAWTRKEGKDPEGGLNRKGVASYRRANPGSKLQTAVTKDPSKIKKGSKDDKRRKSFCRRMSGMKRKLTSAKTANDPDSRINKALRKWNC